MRAGLGELNVFSSSSSTVFNHSNYDSHVPCNYVYLTIQSHWGIWGFKKDILSKDANPFKDSECVNFIFQKLKLDVFPLKSSLPKRHPKHRFLAPKKPAEQSNLEAFAANRNAVVREVLRAKAWEGLKSKEALQ